MEIMLALVVLAVLMWSLYSVICIIYPFRPIRTRRRALGSLALSFGALIIIGTSLPAPEAEAAKRDSRKDLVAVTKPTAATKEEAPIITGKVELEETTPRQAPMKYTADDFMWFEDTASYKEQIVVMVNKIVLENAKCDKADTTSVALSGSKSKPGDPVFFVTCDTSSLPFNVWFRPGDAEKVFTAVKPIGRNDAANACEAYARSAASHPSTVEFSRIMDLGYSTHPNGRARITSSFSAKNAFNLKLKYRIDCLFDGSAMLEANIFEDAS